MNLQPLMGAGFSVALRLSTTVATLTHPNLLIGRMRTYGHHACRVKTDALSATKIASRSPFQRFLRPLHCIAIFSLVPTCVTCWLFSDPSCCSA
jgi:hypothetical protein